MLSQFDLIERAYRGDAAAAADVMRNPNIPDTIKQRLQLPMNDEAMNAELSRIRQALDGYANTLTQRFQRGIKEGFSSAIVSMLKGALWIVLLGFIVTCFVPVLPLRSRDAMAAKPKAAA
jgi:hypothetical protein